MDCYIIVEQYFVVGSSGKSLKLCIALHLISSGVSLVMTFVIIHNPRSKVIIQTS